MLEDATDASLIFKDIFCGEIQLLYSPPPLASFVDHVTVLLFTN